mgnify:CR=1 FL=1
MVVMYDAIGVRQETGKQAKVLNHLLFENPLKLDTVVLQERLKSMWDILRCRYLPARCWESESPCL